MEEKKNSQVQALEDGMLEDDMLEDVAGGRKPKPRPRNLELIGESLAKGDNKGGWNLS